jgi:hypothetical protein
MREWNNQMLHVNLMRVLFASILLAPTLSPADAEVRPDSIVFIECSGEGKTTRGSGVIVSERGAILTAKHVAPAGYQCKGVKGTAATTPIRRLVRRRTSTNHDAMLFEFVREPGEIFHSVQYLALTDAMQNNPITAYGFPRGGVGQISKRRGVISTTFPDEQGNIETDVLTTSGMSGGPVLLDENDGLIGIIAGANFDVATGAPADFAVLAAEQVSNELELVLLDPQSIASRQGNEDAASDLRALAGRWSGVAKEPEGVTFTVELEISQDCALSRPCGTIAVPHVPCRGRLTLIDNRSDGFEFNVDQFDATSDQSVCQPGAGEVLQVLPDGKLSYTATYSGARGVLSRAD